MERIISLILFLRINICAQKPARCKPAKRNDRKAPNSVALNSPNFIWDDSFIQIINYLICFS